MIEQWWSLPHFCLVNEHNLEYPEDELTPCVETNQFFSEIFFRMKDIDV
jgi:hypothetical protein